MSYFPASTITTEAALRDLGSPRARSRAAAAAALGEAEPALRDRVITALLVALDDLDPDVRASAALSLGDLGGSRSVPPLVLRLDDGVTSVRQAAAIALGRLREPDAFDAVRGALASGPPDLRFQAATSLVDIDPERAREPLLAALADADPEVVGAAALALAASEAHEAVDRMAALLDRLGARGRFDVAYALAGLGDARAVPALVAAAADRDLAWDAIEGLEAVGAPAADALARLLENPDTLEAEHRMRAAAALLAAAPEHPAAGAARHILTGALVRPGLRSRHLRRALAVDLLGRVGGDWAVAPLEALRAGPPGRRLTEEIDDALRQARARGTTEPP